MTDLNAAIAKYKGWEYFQNINLWELVVDGYTRLQSDNPPDYEHDANLYMALFEEMKSHCKRVDLGWKVDHYFCIAYDYAAVAHADTIGTAICLAFCKLKGIEVVG
jgi:hypothetical protein